jgi:hypothetical protein
MLPKFIYESLPYINLAIGVAEICFFHSFWTALSGAMFFGAGAVMWVLRSDNRRKDKRTKIRYQYNRGRELYEIKPFFYIVFGLLVTNWLNTPTLHLAGAAVALFGLYLLLKRGIYRRFTVS